MLLRKENIETISSSCLHVRALFYVLLLSSLNAGRQKQEVKESILSTKTRRINFQAYYSKKEEVIKRTQLLKDVLPFIISTDKLKNNLQKSKLTS